MPPATASRSFARQNAPVVSHSYPRTPIVRPLLTQQPAPFPNVANGSLYIHPFDSEKTPCPLFQSTRSVKARLKQRTEKNTKKRARLPRQTVCHLPTRQKKNLSAPRQQASYSTRRSSPSPHDNKQSKEKAEAMPPFKLFSRHSATIGKKQKRIPSPPQLKKTRRNRSPRRPTTNRENAATGHTPPNRAFTFQPRLCRPLRFFCPAPFQILCTALKPLKCRHTKRVEKTFNKKLIPRRKCRTLLTRNRPQTQTRNKKTRKKTSFTQNT